MHRVDVLCYTRSIKPMKYLEVITKNPCTPKWIKIQNICIIKFNIWLFWILDFITKLATLRLLKCVHRRGTDTEDWFQGQWQQENCGSDRIKKGEINEKKKKTQTDLIPLWSRKYWNYFYLDMFIYCTLYKDNWLFTLVAFLLYSYFIIFLVL